MTALASVLAGLLLAPAIATAGWLPATDISAKSEFGFEQVPEIAVGAPGEAIAVWPQLNWHYTVQASSKAPGGGWGPPVNLSPPGEEARAPQVAVNAAGQAVVLWYHLANDETIKAAVRTPQGDWGEPEVVSLPGRQAYEDLDVAIDPSGSAVAIWVGHDSGASEYLIEAATKPAGGSWTPPVELSERGNNAWSPQVAVDPSGRIVATWSHWTDEGDTIIETAGKDPGQPWGETEELSLAGGEAVLEKVATGGGRTVVAWEREEIVEAAVKDAGADWQEPVALSGPDSARPSVGMDAQGNAVALWQYETSGLGAAESSTLPAGEEEWTEPVVLSERMAGEWALPQVAVNPAGWAVATWTAWNGSARIVEAASGTTAGDWKNPVTISPSNAWAQISRIAMDGAGNAAAIWRSGELRTMQTAIFDATGPELRSLAFPASGRAGQPISFAGSPFDAWSPLQPLNWSFGDGSTASGPGAVHHFQLPGRYQVTATATDAAGHSTASTAEITITPALAVAKRLVTVRNGTALLTLRCPGTAVCRGEAGLTRQLVSKKGRRRSVHLGGTVFALGAAAQGTVRMRLTSKALKLLADAPAKGLRVQLSGNAVEGRAVFLKPAPRARKR